MSVRRKIAVISSHPIQYNAPLFKLLAENKFIELKVFYTAGEGIKNARFDPGFKKDIQWDIPLMDGYQWEFVENKAKDPGPHHFFGIDCPDLNKMVREFAPDLILVYGWSFKSHLRLLRHFKNKIPILFRGDSTIVDKSKGIKSGLRKIVLTWVYRYVDYALYVGKNNFDYFKYAGIRDEQLVYVPHAVDNCRFMPNPLVKTRSTELRNSLGMSYESVVLLFSGKLEPKKDPRMLLEVFIEKRLFEKSVLVIVGSGDLESELRELAKGVPHVYFLGFQNQSLMPVIYQMADIYILPSIGPGETWGLAINESMASGCAVIASDKCGGAIDLIEPGVNGFIMKNGDKEDLYIKLLSVIENPILLESMKVGSLKRIKNFDVIVAADKIISMVTDRSMNKTAND